MAYNNAYLNSGKRAVEQETSAAAAKLLSKLHNINTIITAEAAAVAVAATTAITDTTTAITISRATTKRNAGQMSLGKKQQTYVKVWQFQRFLPRANMIFGNRKAGKRETKEIRRERGSRTASGDSSVHLTGAGVLCEIFACLQGTISCAESRPDLTCDTRWPLPSLACLVQALIH